MGGGGVDVEVLADLLNTINSMDVWGSKTLNVDNENVTYLTAKDFGKYQKPDNLEGMSEEAQRAQTSQIVVKLFETTNDTSNSNNVNDATAQYWQAVYRSMGKDDSGNLQDVLTLYMCRPYTSAIFDSTDANYSTSSVRTSVSSLYETLKTTYSSLNTYVVTPGALPGEWQSSEYQTSRNSSRASYSGAKDTGNGASGCTKDNDDFGINNGLDEKGDPHASWSNTNIASAYTDKLWVPSGFEVLHTGYGEKTNSTIKGTGRTFDETNDIVWLDNYDSYENASVSADITSNRGDDRTGLWELNGYDRAVSSSSWTWLRSGRSTSSNNPCGIFKDGSAKSNRVNRSSGVRVALHLDLKKLANDYLTKVTANQKSATGASTQITAITSSNTLQTTLSIYNYSNYVAPNLIAEKYKKTITFNTVSGANQVKSFTLTSGSITKTINIVGASGSGTRETTKDLCDYSYTYENGQLKVTVSNVQTHILNVQANVDGYTTLNLSVTNSAPNSLLVLHFFNGSDKLGECSFVYSSSAQTASITLPKNETIRILATKPFTSRAKFELGGDEVPATGTTTWEIKTQTSSTLNLTVTLIGDGSWSNAIVI